MIKKIYVPVDNSDYSDASIALAVAFARKFGSQLVGSHVYAAKMHDVRFKQMEYTLPEEYQDEVELEKQRRIHDTLITMGLQLISDSYLEVMQQKCTEFEIPFEARMPEGKHFIKLVEDIQEGDYDLVIMGALGMGAVKDSLIGGVCERVVRRINTDTLIVRDLESIEEDKGNILVGIDGSPESFSGLKTAIQLGHKLNRQVEAVGVYDPYLHYIVFNSVVNVLTERAARTFRFKEQEQLHEEVIDTGLAKIYQSHLEVARSIAKEEHDYTLKITLLDGKAYEKILQYARKTNPWLLVLGRIGVHSEQDMDIGSTAENLLRLAPCNVLLSSQRYFPQIDVKAEETLVWTQEALDRMEKAPPLVRGIAKTAVHRFAIERGHSVITESVIDMAMEAIMPQRASEKLTRVAKEIAEQKVLESDAVQTYICGECGYAAHNQQPVKCPVCSSLPERFQMVDKGSLQHVAVDEGGTAEEETFDGVRLQWSEQAKKALRRVPRGYMRRNVKARIEKSARSQKIATITNAFATEIIDDSMGEAAAVREDAPELRAVQAQTDAQNVDVVQDFESPVQWTEEAIERLNLVPAGFMRNITQTRIEQRAQENDVTQVTLDFAARVIEDGRSLANEVIGQYYQQSNQD
jgi:nucleotide-binding universal stress UspA family protein/predicted Zn-ribbon and HTH transcriptional regulator/Zn ribbon nucleic-acid-binding protein